MLNGLAISVVFNVGCGIVYCVECSMLWHF